MLQRVSERTCVDEILGVTPPGEASIVGDTPGKRVPKTSRAREHNIIPPMAHQLPLGPLASVINDQHVHLCRTMCKPSTKNQEKLRKFRLKIAIGPYKIPSL